MMLRSRYIVLFVLILFFFSCSTSPPGTGKGKTNYLTIIAAGDNLYHKEMIKFGEEGDYDSAYTAIRPLLEKADIRFVNQETLLAGEDFGFTGYPQFNSPQALGHAIAAAGFNVVNHANNHVMDKGEKAVFATMDFWDTKPAVTILGIHRSEEQRNKPTLITKNNITLGFLSYTYGTNGLPVPKDKPYLVSLIDTEIMAKEIEAIRPLCDFLIVSMHWGNEYQHHASKRQETLADFLAAHKVDLVIGHHPHVIQPIEFIERPDGKTMVCFYSLGNFLSGQTQNMTYLGALAYIKLEKRRISGTDTIIVDVGAIPTITHYDKEYSNFIVYPLHSYTEELLGQHWRNQWGKQLTMDYLQGLSAKTFRDKEILNP